MESSHLTERCRKWKCLPGTSWAFILFTFQIIVDFKELCIKPWVKCSSTFVFKVTSEKMHFFKERKMLKQTQVEANL